MILRFFLSVLLTASGLLYLYAWLIGTDDLISGREKLILGAAFVILLSGSFLLSKDLSKRALVLASVCAMLTSFAINIEYPELMRLPVQISAENKISIENIDEDTSVWLTWAYRFRPRHQDGDLFLTDPDRDISFSGLIRSGTWEEIISDEGPALRSSEIGASIGVPAKSRFHLAVFCIKVIGTSADLMVSGQDSPIRLTAEMTEAQPYRVIMRNGLLSDTAGCLIQVLIWSGLILFAALGAMKFCDFLRMHLKTNKNVLIYAGAFLIPCFVLILLCIQLKICPFGEKSFLINDMWGEYADYMAYFRTILTGENDLFYSFSKSLGDDLPSLLAFYVINPLNWLVCLFRPEDLPLAVTILVILRFGFSGLTSAVYFVKRRNCGYRALLFSACYALMSFNIVNAENTNLREGTMILPLVVMGLEKLLDGESAQSYIWSLAAVIFLNYYSGYQICVFAVLYFIYYLLRRRTGKHFWKMFVRFIGTSLLGVGISAFLLIPIICQLRNGPKLFDPSIFKMAINMPWQALFGKLLVSAYDAGEIADGFPNLYSGLICALLFPLLFMNRKISSREKILSAGLVAATILILQLNPLNLALHGFNKPLWWPYRYSFIICFFMLILAQRSFSDPDGWTIPAILALAVLSAGLLVVLGFSGYSWMPQASLRLNAVLVFVYLLILAYGTCQNSPHTRTLMAVLTVLELFMNASHILMINTAYERSNSVTDYAAYYEENKPVIDQIKAADSGFYRIEKTYSRTPNDPMLLDYNGISHYSSTVNNHLMNFLPRAGFRLYTPYRFLYWEGSDIAADSLLGIKYLVSGKKQAKPYPPVFETGEHTVYENPYALPLMFTASFDVTETGFMNDNGGFEFQNRVFSKMTGAEIEIFVPADVIGPDVRYLTENIGPNEICYVSDNEEEGTLTWKITVDRPDTLYVFFPADQIHPVSLTLNDRQIGSYFDSFSYHIFRLGSFQPGEQLTLTMTASEDQICMKEALFFYENLSELEKAVLILTEDSTELRKSGSSRLIGSYTASVSDKVLLFTFPYDRGWRVKIDGKTVPTVIALDTFMAAAAPAGTHSVELCFIPVGFIPGVILSFLSLAAVLICMKREKRKACEMKGY